MLNIVVASGRATTAMGFSILLLVLSATLNIFMIPIYRMIGAATAVTLASLISMSILLVYVIHRFGSVVPWITFVKVILSTLLAILIFYIKLSGYVTIFYRTKNTW